MGEQSAIGAKSENRAQRPVAMFGEITTFGALFSAAACCVIPGVFAMAGLGVGGLAVLVPFHWPLTVLATLSVGIGGLYIYTSPMRVS